MEKDIEIVPTVAIPKEYLNRIKNMSELVLPVLTLTKEEIKKIWGKDLK